jgi:hypothetical protein
MSLVLQPDGPGTTVIVRDGAQGLPAAPRGTTAILGMFQSGPTSHAALALNDGAARRIAGDAHDDFEGSLAMGDLYSLYSPPVLIGRVTDGNDVQAKADVWDRKPSRGYLHREDQGDRAPLATVEAHNGGRWGGRKRVYVSGAALTLSAALTSTTTLATGQTVLVNIWAGADLYFEGDTGGPYKVASNTTTGIVTLERAVSQAVTDASNGVSNGIDGHIRIVLGHSHELSIVVGEDNSRGSTFAMNAYRKFSADSDWERVAAYDDLQLSENDDRPWADTIFEGEETDGNYQMALTTSYTGATTEDKLPANFCEIPRSLATNTITYQWYRWTLGSSNTGNPHLEAIAVNDSSAVEPHVITLTFTAATTATATVTFTDGTVITFGTSGLTLGTPYDFEGHPQLCTITCKAGGTGADAGDTLTIRVNTLPLDLYKREAYLYPIAHSDDGDSGVRLRVVSNTYRSVSVRSDLVLTDYGMVAAATPTYTGTTDVTSVTWTSSETIIITPDGGSAVTFTGAGESGWAAIKAALESADTADLFTFEQNAASLKMEIGLQQSTGSQSKLTIGNGTANATFGLTNTDIETGTDGIPFRIEGRFPMWGGYDGDTPGSSRYTLALDLDNHVFRRHMMTNLGLVRVGTPGVTNQAVKTAAETLVRKHGWKYVAEFSKSLEAGSDPVADAVNSMLANEIESDFVDHIFPSRGKFRSVNGRKVVTRSLFGVFAGRKALMANSGVDGERGFHIATANANEQGLLSPRVIGLSTAIGRWTPSSIKYANDHGIVLVLWSGSSLYLWGNRMYSKGRTPTGARYTITERDVYYHVARDLFVTTRPFIFKSVSISRLSSVVRELRSKMKTYWADGWFSDYAGAGFADQVTVAAPLESNQAVDLAEGRVTANISFRPRASIEDLVIVITPTEVSEG